ncbi:MAG: hypothetical protein RMK52_00565 [Chitinophagales bacterium]|nr:hypothetical protein [Chitinophagales bacterium]MDW8392718.1 hypothetical protein [Chitinophagales bacterium]
MKIVAIALMLFAAALPALAQQELKQAVDDFHYSLAFTYHPMADEGNYDPIRKRSGELVEKARQVEQALYATREVPKELESRVDVLAESCAALHAIIQQGATDEAIYQRLTRIHDLFHEVEDVLNDWILKR